MGAWTRNVVKKKSVFLASAATDTTYSEPAATSEAAAADHMISFVNVDRIDQASGTALKVYRYHGSRGDLLRRLDAAGAPVATITTTGVTEIAWPYPMGAAAMLQIDFVSATTATQEAIYEVDNVYRTDG